MVAWRLVVLVRMRGLGGLRFSVLSLSLCNNSFVEHVEFLDRVASFNRFAFCLVEA